VLWAFALGMRLPRIGLVCLLSTTSLACGIPQEEHDKALATQKQRLDGEMKKAKEAHETLLAKETKKVSSLQGDVASLNSSLVRVTEELDQLDERLGVKSIELVTARTEIKSAQEKVAQTDEVLKEKDASLKEADAELETTKAELEQVRRLRQQAESAAKSFQALALKLKSMVDSGKLEVIRRKGRMMVKLPDDILFQPGRQRLKKAGRRALNEVAGVLKDVENRNFLVAGHTDNIPMKKGRYKSNWDLSTARAVEVVKLMVKAGVPAERLAAAGYGEFDPVEDNATREGRSKNRRLEIILMPNLDELPKASE
jgi:chemotaxis protein MotB